MKRALLTFTLVLATLSAFSQTPAGKVVDESGAPLIGAVVLNNSGTPIDIVDNT